MKLAGKGKPAWFKAGKLQMYLFPANYFFFNIIDTLRWKAQYGTFYLLHKMRITKT